MGRTQDFTLFNPELLGALHERPQDPLPVRPPLRDLRTQHFGLATPLYLISFAKSSHSVSVLSTAYYISLMLRTVHYIVSSF